MSRNYDAVKRIIDEDTICKIKCSLPREFSSEDFLYYFLLYFPPGHAELIKHLIKDKRLLNWLNSHYIRGLESHFKQLRKEITKPNVKKWTTNLNHKEYSYLVNNNNK